MKKTLILFLGFIAALFSCSNANSLTAEEQVEWEKIQNHMNNFINNELAPQLPIQIGRNLYITDCIGQLDAEEPYAEYIWTIDVENPSEEMIAHNVEALESLMEQTWGQLSDLSGENVAMASALKKKNIKFSHKICDPSGNLLKEVVIRPSDYVSLSSVNEGDTFSVDEFVSELQLSDKGVGEYTFNSDYSKVECNRDGTAFIETEIGGVTLVFLSSNNEEPFYIQYLINLDLQPKIIENLDKICKKIDEKLGEKGNKIGDCNSEGSDNFLHVYSFRNGVNCAFEKSSDHYFSVLYTKDERV